MPEDDTGTSGRIYITNRELYDILGQVRDNVHSLDLKVNSVLGENVDLRKRVRSLELRFYGILAGLITAAGVIVWRSPS